MDDCSCARTVTVVAPDYRSKLAAVGNVDTASTTAVGKDGGRSSSSAQVQPNMAVVGSVGRAAVVAQAAADVAVVGTAVGNDQSVTNDK